MSLRADKVARGERVQALQKRICGEGDTNGPFLRLLTDVAARQGIPIKWEPARLSKIRSGTQDLSLEDVATLIHVARDHGITDELGDWYWLSFGVRGPAKLAAGGVRKPEPNSGSHKDRRRA